MYSTGKVTTTANTTKVVGTNTKWKDNNSLISPEQVILIQNGATIYINSIASIQSNTEMTLSFPVPATVKEATYNILTTMVHSVSDAANKIVAMNNANVQFSDILNRWATETGTITVTLPDGTKQQLRTAKEMDKQLDGKFDKAGGAITGTADVLKLRKSDNNAGIYLRYQDTAGVNTGYIGYASSTASFSIVNQIAGSSLVLAADKTLKFNDTNVMLTGDYGVGIASAPDGGRPKDWKQNGFFMGRKESDNSVIFGFACNHSNSAYGFSLFGRNGNVFFITREAGVASLEQAFYTTKNTTKDSNGNLKAASPIVKVFADHIELNDESEGVELKCLHTGIYQLKHVLGLNSDASWGGINGGITIPSGINQLPLIYVDYDVLVAGEQHPFNGEPVPQEEHGDIVIYTSYRKHFDLPQNVQRARLKTYPEFTKLVGDERVELENGAPVDIPAGHWIDVRVNMPSNSIYNQKQAEAEAYAKEEAERVAQEAAEQVEQQ
ncbi:hypothetical protein [Moellerella wisconsensis]|uniref:phage tail fiber protein n=1 Tax=Moellerella wisconsensis TaxID=158849 RepID=UPI002410389D|nr:hypothetical protein [Moellerella wisconsensis]